MTYGPNWGQELLPRLPDTPPAERARQWLDQRSERFGPGSCQNCGSDHIAVVDDCVICLICHHEQPADLEVNR